jgi:hypothetical protein
MEDTAPGGGSRPSDWTAIDLAGHDQFVLIHPKEDGAEDRLCVVPLIHDLSPRRKAARRFLEWL